MEDLITAGEFAKHACTTKRTILFYDEKGVLKPVKIDDKGYRYYSQRQILDYQLILLLTSLGVHLKDLKDYLTNRGKLTDLFSEKRPQIVRELRNLEFNLKNVDYYLKNLRDNKTMLKPEQSNFKPLTVYYIEKTGSYANIGDYCLELSEMFEKPIGKLTTMAIFEDQEYRPKNSHIKVAAFADKPLKIKKDFEDLVKKMEFNPGKVISYKYRGAGEMLSLFWKELEKYCDLNNINVRKNSPDFEIYWKVSSDPTKQLFEIFIPVY